MESSRTPFDSRRLMDCVGALVGLALFALPMLLVALAIRLTMGSPILFRQERPGRGEHPFVLFKFRTMRDARDASGEPLPDAQRLTRLGCFLRSTTLDELPEFLNVLEGDMSLVGPRPLLMKYLPYYTPRERLRFRVRPGMTGWAQINGRNLTHWDERLELDAWYVENRSLLLDFRILLLTLPRVLGAKGVVVDPRSQGRDLDEERKHQPTPWGA